MGQLKNSITEPNEEEIPKKERKAKQKWMTDDILDICELHRTISLMSHVTKILLRIVLMKVRSKIRPEIAEEQCGFVEGKETSNAIFLLRTIIELTLECQKEVYLCFIYYTKAFDRVQHMEIIKQLQKLHVDGKDLRIIKNIYWEQTATVKIENETCAFQDIKRSTSRMCPFTVPFQPIQQNNSTRAGKYARTQNRWKDNE